MPVLLAAAALAAPATAGADQAPAPPPPPDTTAPVLTGVSISTKAVKAAAGAKVSFTLSEDANVAGAVFAHRSGYLVEGKCRLDAARRGPGKHRHTRKACSKLVRIGSFFAATALKGPNVAKLGFSVLKPARYRLVLTPRDRTGNLGKAANIEFQIIKS